MLLASRKDESLFLSSILINNLNKDVECFGFFLFLDELAAFIFFKAPLLFHFLFILIKRGAQKKKKKTILNLIESKN